MTRVFKLDPKEYAVITKWAALGMHFGYPACCVGEFIANAVKGINPPKRQFNGTGYVPCHDCNKLSRRTLLKHIKSLRSHSLPFPKQNEDEL